MSTSIDISNHDQIEALYKAANEGTLTDPTPDDCYQLAEAALRIGENDNARLLAQTLLTLDASHDKGWVLLGRIQEHCSEIAAAIVAYEKAIEINPDGRTALAIASLYINTNDIPKARQWLRFILDSSLKAQADGAFVQAVALWDRLEQMEG